MTGLVRLLGSGASLSATAFQMAVIAATWPIPPGCSRGLCRLIVEPDLVEPFIGWEPFIDNVGVGAKAAIEPRCPGAQGNGSNYRLDHAPLPPGFNAHAYPASEILACVKLGADGSVESVRIRAGTGRAGLDSRLVRAIRKEWRFRPVDGVEGGPAWQRVRLNSGYGSQPLADPAAAALEGGIGNRDRIVRIEPSSGFGRGPWTIAAPH